MSARDDLLAALRALDSAALDALALETGIGLSTLWHYRSSGEIPEARQRVLARALALR